MESFNTPVCLSALLHQKMNLEYPDRKQGLGEEIANSISHGIGFLGAVAVTPFLVVKAIPLGATAIVGVSVFGLTMMLLYISSTLYHAFPHNKAKRVFQIDGYPSAC